MGKKFEEERRVVHINTTEEHELLHKHYQDNYVRTTKYNIFTFLPKALFEQYRWVAQGGGRMGLHRPAGGAHGEGKR